MVFIIFLQKLSYKVQSCDAEIQATLKHGLVWKLAEEYKVYRYKFQRKI